MFRLVLLALAFAVLCPPHATPVAADSGVVVATVTVADDASITLRVFKGRLAVGIPFHIDAEVVGTVTGVDHVRLHSSPALLVKGGSDQGLHPEQLRARWALCSERTDTYVVMASLEWPGGRRVESEAVVIEIASSRKAACPKPWE